MLTNDDNQLIDFTYDGNSNITGSNFLTGRAVFNAIAAAISNLAGQTLDPCFSGFKFKQAAVAALLGGTKGFGNLPKVSGTSPAYFGREVVVQSGNNLITDLAGRY